jgi:hypothetical protein
MEQHVLSRSASPHDARPGTSTPPSSTALLRADSHSPLPSPGLDYTPPVAPFVRERPVFASRSTLRSTYVRLLPLRNGERKLTTDSGAVRLAVR